MSSSTRSLGRLVVLGLLAVAIVAAAEEAAAGNRKSTCGGLNQTPCRLFFPDFMSPSCDTTIPWLYENFSQDKCLALGCGGVDQPACTIAQHIPSCNPGLPELIGPQGAYCRQIDGDGYPTVCGGVGERPCWLTEHIPSCKPGLGEVPFPGGNCIQLDSEGFPPFCGGENERPCLLNEHIPSCKPTLAELLGPNGLYCAAFDAGFPKLCGDAGERACLVTEHIPSCRPNAYEVATPNIAFPLNGRCVQREDFSSAPFSLSRSTLQAPPGPRSIFLIHGLGSDSNSYAFDALHDPSRGLVRHWFDYNASGNYAGDTVRVFRGNSSVACVRGQQVDGYAISLPEVSRHLRDVLLDPTCRDTTSGPTPRPGGIENVTLIAHSMGGLVARDLVARHYDALLAQGVRIAEVVLIAVPNRGGGAGLPEVYDAQGLLCLIPPNLVGSFGRAIHQACLIEKWQAALRGERSRRSAGGAPFVDNLDFPGIRWVVLGAVDSDVVPAPLSFEAVIWGPSAVPRHDSIVAHVSAFGVAPDLCFPNVDTAAPSAFIPSPDPNSAAWFEHFWPADFFVSTLRFSPEWIYNLAHGFDVSPAAQVSLSPQVLGRGTLTASCHGPGPNSPEPGRSYLFDALNGAFRIPGVASPHGDIVDTNVPAEHRGGVAVMHYLKSVLTDGLRGPDVNADGLVDAADRNRVLAAISAGPTSAIDVGFDVWSDLDGDGFLTTADLQAGGLGDPDADGVIDAADNCPNAANASQLDAGGVGLGSASDGIGDACQCGDVNDDGLVSGLDGTLIKRAALGLAPFAAGVAALPAPNKCDVNGGTTGDGVFHCSGLDATLIQRASLGLPPGVLQLCPAADGS